MPQIDFEPAPEIASYVAGYHGLTTPSGARTSSVHSLNPDGCISLLSQRTARGEARASLVGPRTDALALPAGPGDRIWIVRFWPDAGGALLGKEAEDLAGHFVSPLTSPSWTVSLLRALADCSDADSAGRVADELLKPMILEAKPLDAAVRMAVQALIVTHGEMSIADVAAGVGLSLRQLERRFLSAVGLNPIQYARIRRLRGDLAPLMGMPLTWNALLEKLPGTRP